MRAIAAALLTLGMASPAFAAQDPEEPPRWNAEAGLSVNSSGGNEELTVITTELGLTHLRTQIFEFGVDTRLRYGRSEGEEVARNLRGNTNFDLWPEAAWSPFLFGTAEQDPFKRLQARLNGGVGLKRTFWQEDWNEVSLSGAVLYSFENLEVPDSLGDGITQTARWSWRLRGRQEIGEGSRLEQVFFFQPAWDDFEDYQFESATSARVSLSERLAFTATFLYQRDNTPAPEVEPDDYSLAIGLSLATRW